MFVLLRRQLLPNPDSTDILNPFLDLSQFWDTEHRRPYATQTPTSGGTPFELGLGDEVDRWLVKAGKIRVVVYAGEGRVQTQNITGSIPGSGNCTIALPLAYPERGYVTTDSLSNAASPEDGYVKVFGRERFK